MKPIKVKKQEKAIGALNKYEVVYQMRAALKNIILKIFITGSISSRKQKLLRGNNNSNSGKVA